jgi:hypothetical protein
MYPPKTLLSAVLIASLPFGAALGQSSSGGGGGSAGGGAAGAGASSATGAASGVGGRAGFNGSMVNGTGGSQVQNTSEALNRGSTGNNMGAPQTGGAPGAPASHGNAIDTPAANSAVQSLSNTDAGILKK